MESALEDVEALEALNHRMTRPDGHQGKRDVDTYNSYKCMKIDCLSNCDA